MDCDENCEKELRTIFDCVPPKCGALLVGVVADILADGLNSVQITTLGSFVAAVGDTLAYIGAQMELNEQIVSRQKEKA